MKVAKSAYKNKHGLPEFVPSEEQRSWVFRGGAPTLYSRFREFGGKRQKHGFPARFGLLSSRPYLMSFCASICSFAK
jgi:hypothetical protein